MARIKRSSKSNKRKAERLKRQVKTQGKAYGLAGIAILIISGIVLLAGRTVIQMKSGESDRNASSLLESGEVLGILDVPSFPGSEFLFAEDLDNNMVEKFLSEGKSAYRIPEDSTWSEVCSFYETEMDRLGWKHELSVDHSDELRRWGEYWTKDNRGLRIYTKLNDIWFEQISLNQAKDGLSDIVAHEKQLELMMAKNAGEELPSNFPWQLKFSSEWNYEISETDLLGIEKVNFTSSDRDSSLVIEPIDFASLEPISIVAGRYIETANNLRDPMDEFLVEESSDINIAGQSCIRLNLRSDNGTGYVAVITQPDSGVIYAIRSFDGEKAFFEYVLENIEILNLDN